MKTISKDLWLLEELLRKYKEPARADLIATCCSLFESDERQVWQTIDSLSWWGGSGSVADLVLIDNSHSLSEEEQRADNHLYESALISIYQAMVKVGLKNERADFWVKTFQSWHRKGIT